jgi:hypothetical protein
VLLALLLSAEQATTQQWTATLRTRAGAVDGPGTLSDVFHVELGPENEILAVQPTVPTISVFDASGRFLRDIGRSGAGPGEFRVVGRIGWTRDTLWAMDPAAGRLHLFDRRLQFARTITPIITDQPTGVMRLLPGPLLADGSILGIPFNAPGTDSEPLILLTESGSIRRTLGRISTRGNAIPLKIRSGPGGEQRSPWADYPLWIPTADGGSIIIVSRPVATRAGEAHFGIARIDLEGDTIANARVPYSPVPLSRRARDQEYRSIAQNLARSPMRSGTVAQLEEDVRSSIPAPEFFPPVNKVVAGRDGTIWLRREPATGNFADWQIFSAAGTELGRVQLPAALRVYGAEAGRVWGVARDDLDVSFAEVYQVTR